MEEKENIKEVNDASAGSLNGIQPEESLSKEDSSGHQDLPDPGLDLNEQQEKESTNQENEIAFLKTKIDELNDKYLRLYSEFENYRRRIQKEKTDWIKYSGEDILKHILPVLDDFDRAIKHNKNIEDSEKLKEGFQLIYNKLLQLLKQKGLEPMNSVGELFNPEFMEAITQVTATKESLKGKVMDEVEKGYKLYDRVIRPAKVVVGG
ncbi:MAG: nucleotide exchange factor GrpE [Bacteroidia bacterium]|nr:nucleotide exchange factor GrpE [Bacteroidia bacterium]